jgi:hypothetical protein
MLELQGAVTIIEWLFTVNSHNDSDTKLMIDSAVFTNFIALIEQINSMIQLAITSNYIVVRVLSCLFIKEAPLIFKLHYSKESHQLIVTPNWE